jgi:hypothetical protein
MVNFYSILPLMLSGSARRGGGGKGGGVGDRGGGETGTTHFTFIAFNKADFTNFRNTRFDRLYLIYCASFQILGNVKIGNLFVVAEWWAGT